MEQIGETKQIIEGNAKNAPTKDILWNANEISAEPVRIVDPGVGQEVIVRHFFFKSIPLLKGQSKPTKLELISHFKKLIEMSLWGDGLVIREDKPLELVELHIAKKNTPFLYKKMLEQSSDFVLLVLASPKAGLYAIEKPTRLQ